MESSELGLRALRSQAQSEAQPAGAERTEAELWAALENPSDARTFVESWLALQCGLVRGARRGLVLLGAGEGGRFETAAVWPAGRAPAPTLLAAAERALAERRPLVTAAPEPEAESAAPLAGALLALPVVSGSRLRGALVLEVAPRPEAELNALAAQLRFGLSALRTLFAGETGASRTGGRVESVLATIAAALEHERFQGAATALVTELATALGCERVAVGFVRRGRVRLRGLSHSAQFGKKTNLVRGIEAAMDEALDQDATLVFPSPSSELSEVTHAHGELAREHGSRAICTLPLQRGEEVCGALTLERASERPFEPAEIELAEAVAALAGPVLEALRREDRWLGSKAAESLRGALGKLLGPRHVAAKLIALALLALALFLAFVQGDFRITADAVLEPSVLRASAAPFEGYLAEAPVRPGDVVEPGALLAALDDRDLRLERFKWQSQLAQADKQYRQALVDRDAAQAAVLAAAVGEARAELDRIDARLAHTRLLAPFEGVVVTGDLSQRLGAPVERGEVLFEVAPLDGWRVVLQVDERDIEQVALGQRGKLVLASMPSAPLEFEVAKITPVATAEEGQNSFRVEGRPLGETPQLRPGVEGVAKVTVGRRRLAWIWSHDLVDWLRLRFWAWLP